MQAACFSRIQEAGRAPVFIMAPVGRFLPALTERLVTTAQHDPPLTLDFVDTMSKVIPIFDHLGACQHVDTYLSAVFSDWTAPRVLTERRRLACRVHALLCQVRHCCKGVYTGFLIVTC